MACLTVNAFGGFGLFWAIVLLPVREQATNVSIHTFGQKVTDDKKAVLFRLRLRHAHA